MNEEHLALLVTELQDGRYNNLSVVEGYAKLHAVTETVVQVQPVPLTIANLMAGLSPQSLANLDDWTHLEDFRDKVLAQDREGVGIYAGIRLAAGKITSDEYAAIMAVLAATAEVEVTSPVTARVVVIGAGVPGFPNTVEYEDFTTAWTAAGRN